MKSFGKTMCSILISVCRVGCLIAPALAVPGWAQDASHPTADAPCQAIPQIAVLYQNGDEPIDVEHAQELLLGCAKAVTDSKRRADRASEDVYDALEAFFRYADSRRVSAEDILALRRWQLRDVRCTDAPDGGSKSLAGHLATALHEVGDSLSDETGVFENRHAVLSSALNVMPSSFPDLMLSAVLARQAKSESGRSPGGARPDGEERPLVAFLLRAENQPLFNALLQDRKVMEQVMCHADYWESNDLFRACVENKDDLEKFRRAWRRFLVVRERAIKMIPGYALPERFSILEELRAAWNVVHAYGDEDLRAETRTFVESLRDYYKSRSDDLTVKWLEEVMKPPGKAIERIETIVLVPDDEDDSEKSSPATK
jgi:hypothetical protein